MRKVTQRPRSARQSTHRLLAVLPGLALAGSAFSVANAAPFDALGAGLTLENTIPDLDFYQLTQFVGLVPGSHLAYGATIIATGFTAFMSGTYAGQSLSVSYTANSSAFPGGPVTWTSTGSYGASTWTGSGSAAFTFPTSTTFTETYVSSLVLGANTGSASLLIDGLDSPVITYTDATGAIVVNGDPKDTYPTIKDPDNPKAEELTSDDVCVGVPQRTEVHWQRRNPQCRRHIFRPTRDCRLGNNSRGSRATFRRPICDRHPVARRLCAPVAREGPTLARLRQPAPAQSARW